MLQSDTTAPQGAKRSGARLPGLEGYTGSLAARSYQALRTAILTLEYRPGELLRKTEICAALGISRSPLSEAIARLAAEGLVDVVPQAGTYVARFSMAEIREGAFLREAIEVAAVEYLAGRITDDDLTILRRNLRLQEALFADGDHIGFHAADAEMHAAILSMTGYRKLAQVAEAAWLHVNRARRLILPVPGRVAATLDEHQRILAALDARDPAAARAAMRHHLGQLMTFLAPLEKERPDLFAPGAPVADGEES